jgi:hypothetical protein
MEGGRKLEGKPPVSGGGQFEDFDSMDCARPAAELCSAYPG